MRREQKKRGVGREEKRRGCEEGGKEKGMEWEGKRRDDERRGWEVSLPQFRSGRVKAFVLKLNI